MWQGSHDDSVLIGKIRAGTPVPALDTADYIGRQVAAGTRKGDIAKHLNRSAAFVSQHFKLLSLPAPIARALEFGIINDITVVSDLTVVYEFSPSLVTKWLSDRDQDISRSAVKELKTTSGYEAWRKTA